MTALPAGEGGELRLPLPASKVVPLGRDERLSGPEQAELYRRCPRGERNAETLNLLRVILTLTAGRRRLFAKRETLIAESGMTWRTLKRHRAALVDAGILEQRGGGTRGRGPAVYWIRSPAEVDEWLTARAERVLTAQRAGPCPICGQDPPTHHPRRCPDFARPIQGRMDVEGSP